MKTLGTFVLGVVVGGALTVLVLYLFTGTLDWEALLSRPKDSQLDFSSWDSFVRTLRSVLTGWNGFWFVFGLLAQGIFMARFIVQWLASERAGRSTVPVAFWFISLAGGLSLLTYFVRQGEPIGILGQSIGVLIYARNLWLIYRRRDATGEENR